MPRRGASTLSLRAASRSPASRRGCCGAREGAWYGLSGRVGRDPVPRHAMSQIYVSQNHGITDDLYLLQSLSPSPVMVHAPGPGLARSPPVPRNQSGDDTRAVRRLCHGCVERFSLGVWGSLSLPSARAWRSRVAGSERLAVGSARLAAHTIDCGFKAPPVSPRFVGGGLTGCMRRGSMAGWWLQRCSLGMPTCRMQVVQVW